MITTDDIFGEAGFPRVVIVLGYIVAVIAGVFMAYSMWVPMGLLLATSAGMIVLGTLKEHRNAQDTEE